MTDEERRNRNDGRTSATDQFATWYKYEYMKQEKQGSYQKKKN